MNNDHDQLLRAAQEDTGNFAGLYQAFSGMVYNVALRMLGRVEDAEEVTQDVFVAVHRSLSGFDGRSSIKTWIYRITINTALNALRKRKRRKVEVPMSEGVDYPDEHQDVRAAAHGQQVEARAQKILGALDPDQRACLLLRAQEQLSYEEIASVLGININTVRSRLKRGREAAIRIGQQKGFDHDM